MGFSTSEPFFVCVAMGCSPGSEFDLYGTFRRVDAGADALALLTRDLAVAQVADPAGGEPAHARVADALAAAVRQVEARLLAGHEHGSGAVALRLAVALQELDRAAVALLDVADLRLEALEVELLAYARLLELLLHRVDHLGGAPEEPLPLPPGPAEVVEGPRRHSARLPPGLLLQPETPPPLRE